MLLKYIFDRLVSFLGILCLWWIFPIVALLIKIKMPGPVLFVQNRVGKDGKIFKCHKFRSMTVAPKENANSDSNPNSDSNQNANQNANSNQNSDSNSNANGWSSVSVAGEARITPLGAKLRKYKIDELPELWDVLIGNMSFVGPRPDVPGYADKLQGDDRVVLKLRPGITGPATLKYRDEEEQIAAYVEKKQQEGDNRSTQEIAVEYNDTVIYPDKVRLNKYYYEHYSFVKDIQMIFATVLGFKVKFGGEYV